MVRPEGGTAFFILLSAVLEADSDLICQAGTRWEDINQTLKDKGIPLFFPVNHFLS